MINLFEVIDRSGRLIRLPAKRWRHITHEHPNVTDIHEVIATITIPLVITQSFHDAQVRYYYSYHKTKRRYLFVGVKYLNGTGFIITSYYVRKIT